MHCRQLEQIFKSMSEKNTARLEHIGTDLQTDERKKYCYLRYLLMNCSNSYTGL